MGRVIRIVPAMGVALILIGGLTAATSAFAASTSSGSNAGSVLTSPDPTAESTSDVDPTQSPGATRSPATTKTADATRTVEPTEEIPTDTPTSVPTSTNTATATATATATNPAKTHTPGPDETEEASTGTPDDATQPAGSPSPQSTVLGAVAPPPAGVVLPTTGTGPDSSSSMSGMLAGLAMLIGGTALVLVSVDGRRRR
jgi:hypothetical protein